MLQTDTLSESHTSHILHIHGSRWYIEGHISHSHSHIYTHTRCVLHTPHSQVRTLCTLNTRTAMHRTAGTIRTGTFQNKHTPNSTHTHTHKYAHTHGRADPNTETHIPIDPFFFSNSLLITTVRHNMFDLVEYNSATLNTNLEKHI